MLEGEQITLYHWHGGIEKELCNIIGIPEDKFYNYHDIIGGKYKNLWHVCLDEIIPEKMANDTIVTMWKCHNDKKYKGDESWKNAVLRAWNKIYDEVSPNDEGVLVSFSW